jgi:hypothetical protein
MPNLKLIPLSETLSEEELAKLAGQLGDLGIKLDDADDSHDLDEVLGEDQLTDFMDKLDALDVACDVYLPQEFEGVLEVGERTVGSAPALLEALEELRDELDIDDDSADMADDEIDLEMIEEQLSYAWHLFSRAANASVARGIPLHVIS